MHLTLLMAQTLDGKIARNSKHNADWTSRADKKYFIQKTKEVGTVIMGLGTFEAMGRYVLPGRFNLVLADPPYPKEPQTEKLEYFSGEPRDVVAFLEKKGIEKAVLGGGAFTNNQFLQAGLVNEVHLTIASKLFGEGMGFCDGEALDMTLERTSVQELSDDTLLVTFNCMDNVA